MKEIWISMSAVIMLGNVLFYSESGLSLFALNIDV